MDNSNAVVNSTISLTEERALKLLGSGIPPATVAASLGISQSRISQLLSDENFAAKVAERRFLSISKHNDRDDRYDELEVKLVEKIEDALPLMHRPMEIINAIRIINGAKRRGSSAPESIQEKQSVIQLVVPITLINKFQTNLQGQVVSVGEQNLLTIQSGQLDGLVKKGKDLANVQSQNDPIEGRVIREDSI